VPSNAIQTIVITQDSSSPFNGYVETAIAHPVVPSNPSSCGGMTSTGTRSSLLLPTWRSQYSIYQSLPARPGRDAKSVVGSGAARISSPHIKSEVSWAYHFMLMVKLCMLSRGKLRRSSCLPKGPGNTR